MTGPVCCCKTTPDPGPWKAGVDDAADPEMIARMHAVRDRLNVNMSNEDLIWVLKASAQLDQRTRLGYHIQCCVIWNATHRLELLAKGVDPNPWSGLRARISAAWEIIRRRGVLVRTFQ